MHCRIIPDDPPGLGEEAYAGLPGALEDFTKGIGTDPHVAEIYYNRGVIKILTGTKTAGCADLKKADTIGSDNARAGLAHFCK